MKMPGRYGNEDGNYRYGFNGMEMDDEMFNQEGNSYDFGARMYDSRIGRWSSLDAHSKPWKSNYQFALNSPIVVVDLDGNDDYYCNSNGEVIAVVETDFAPRFFKFENKVVEQSPGVYIGATMPKQFHPTAGQIEASNSNQHSLIMDIAFDFAQAGDKEMYNGIVHEKSVRTVADGHHKGRHIAYFIGGLIVATAGEAIVLQGIVEEGLGKFVIKEVLEEVIEEVAGIPIGIDPIDLAENGLKKILRKEVREKVYEQQTKKIAKGEGSYTITFESGKKYHGKGNIDRAIESASEKYDNYDDLPTGIDWTPSSSKADAFRDEAKRLNNDGGIDNMNNYNIKDSPGNHKYKTN